MWDPLVRALHWGLVASVTLSWLGTFALAGWHQPAGYAALAIVLLRLLWGGIGSRLRALHGSSCAARAPPGPTCWPCCSGARRATSATTPWARCMVLALLACVGALALTGWLYTTD